MSMENLNNGNVNETIQKYLNDPEHKVVFLVGAGVSAESGVPTVNWFFDEFFKQMGLPDVALKWIRQSRIPFEFVMEILQKRFKGKVDELCKVFKGSTPNDIHHLVMSAFLKYENVSVLSSNFDPLLEKAAQKSLSFLIALYEC